MATVESTPGADIRVITEPEVYLIGRQTIETAELDRFLSDHGVSWQDRTGNLLVPTKRLTGMPWLAAGPVALKSDTKFGSIKPKVS